MRSPKSPSLSDSDAESPGAPPPAASRIAAWSSAGARSDGISFKDPVWRHDSGYARIRSPTIVFACAQSQPEKENDVSFHPHISVDFQAIPLVLRRPILSARDLHVWILYFFSSDRL